MGNEIKRDVCPPKLYQGNLFVNSLPVILALAPVAYISGSLFVAAGLHLLLTITIEAIFVIGLYAFFCTATAQSLRLMAELYISICENGISGICTVNGRKNKPFHILYRDIKKINYKGNRLIITAEKETVSLPVTDPSGVATLIKSKIPA